MIHPVAKGVRQKGVWQKSDEKSDRSIRKSDQKVTERLPQTKKSDRTPFAGLLFQGFLKGGFVRGVNLNNWSGARTGCNN